MRVCVCVCVCVAHIFECKSALIKPSFLHQAVVDNKGCAKRYMHAPTRQLARSRLLPPLVRCVVGPEGYGALTQPDALAMCVRVVVVVGWGGGRGERVCEMVGMLRMGA